LENTRVKTHFYAILPLLNRLFWGFLLTK
jgi:hypothetical protein